MIFKVASFTFRDIKKINNYDKNGIIVKTASEKLVIEPGTDKAKIVESEIKKHPNALFFRAKAIPANVVNSNGDYFTEEELIKSYKTFEGVPFFTNHDNQNVENARGKVIFAEWVPEKKAIYTICFIDRDAYPHICRSIEEEYVTGVSMGTSVDYSICNICENKAERTEDFCQHIRNRKGRKFTGSVRNVNTGEVKHFKDELVFEYNHGLKFIELSAVVDPAFPCCGIEAIIENQDYLKKVAKLENDFRMIKLSAISKKASQQEIDELNQCLQTLEQIAINLIQNRQQVEMEFSSDLVKIMSDLQTWLDELVAAGYGNIEGEMGGMDQGMEGMEGDMPNDMTGPMQESGQIPGVVGNTEDMPMPPQSPMGKAKPISFEEESVGTISGSPNKPSVSSPKFPINAPVKPRTSNSKDIIRNAKELCDKINNTGDNNMARRTTVAKNNQKSETIKILSNSWKEKQEFFEYVKNVPSIKYHDNILSVSKRNDSFIIVAEKENNPDINMIWTYENLSDSHKKQIIDSPKEAAINLLNTFAKNQNNQKEGVKMTEMNKQAGANTKNTDIDSVQEKQLERQDLYHSRDNSPRDVITQKQLDSVRTNVEQDVVTQKQLDSVRMDNTPEVITEAQMNGDNRKNYDPDVVTQKQLDEYRKNNEPEVITEKQLQNSSTPWSRMSKRNKEMFKSASEHMMTVVDVISDTCIKTSCTPDEACNIAGDLVDGLENRYNLSNSLLEDKKSIEDIDYSKRLSYWQNKNLKIASIGKKEIAKVLVDSLRTYASDDTYSIDLLIDALEMANEEIEVSNEVISKNISKKLKEASKKENKPNKKEELRKALKNETASSKQERQERRKNVLSSIKKNQPNIFNKEAAKKSDILIETSFDELQCKKDNPDFKKEIVSFTKGALASNNMKLASITNVTIDGNTIQIAVQTDTEENEVNIDTGDTAGTTEIPVDENAMPEEMEQLPEGDMTGEGLENNLEPQPMGQQMGQQMGSQYASKKSLKIQKTAQSPMGGGMPGNQDTSAAPEQGLPTSPENMTDQDAVQTLTTDDFESEPDTEIPTDGEQQMPWTICPECGSSDVDASNEDGNIKGTCNNCSAEYEAYVEKEVKFKIIKPTKSIGEEGTAVPETPEEPEVPALPVAARTKLDKNSIVRIAKNKEKYGEVCPACGNKNCKASKNKDGHVEFTCSACNTFVAKDIMINKKNSKDSFINIQWDVRPNGECKECVKAAQKFASQIKVGKMLKNASANSDKFPMTNCLERVARNYGGNTVGSYGPCKGKLLAECVCKQLQKIGFSKIRHLKKLASISMQKDPWDECMEDQTKNKGHNLKEAETICDCIRKKSATEWHNNIYAQAFEEDVEAGKESSLNVNDLYTLNTLLKKSQMEEVKSLEDEMIANDEMSIGADLEPLEEIQIETEPGQVDVKMENVNDVNEDLKAKENDLVSDFNSDELDLEKLIEDVENEENFEVNELENELENEQSDLLSEEEELSLAMSLDGRRVRNSSKEVFKMSSSLNKVDSIEGNVRAGVPRGDATMGQEGRDNIDVEMKKPSIPRSKATMGKEGPDNIDKTMLDPDVPIDSSYMGGEREVQKGMPEINNDIKGTVLAKKLQEVDSVIDDVEAGVPRGKATIGNEGRDNIDVEMKKPNVPRSNATMGKEGPDNINPKAEGPDVPTNNAYIGGEKDTQKDMPGINDKMLKQVEMKRQMQLEKIAQARKNEAIKTTAWLVSNSRIDNDRETFDTVVEALSSFSTDKIQTVANKMFPQKKVTIASNQVTNEDSGPKQHAIPAIIMEPKEVNANTQEDAIQKMASGFTIGNRSFDEKLTIYGERE